MTASTSLLSHHRTAFWSATKWTFGVSAVMVLIFALQQLGTWWNSWGIMPRSFGSWKGFFLAQLMHGSWAHLIGNLSAFVGLGLLAGSLYPTATKLAMPIIWISAFVCIWLFGAPNTSHIGASGLVYGLMSFAVCMGLYRRDIKTIVGALVVLVIYGGAVWGLLPKQGVSFTAHAGGVLGGILAAKGLHNMDKVRK